MKLKPLALAVLSVFFHFSCKKSCPTPVAANIDLKKGLVAYYPFSGNTNDESGNNNNGTLVNGGALSHDKNGKSLSALNISGNGQKVVVQNNGKIIFDAAMTISFQVMQRSINRSNIICMTDVSSAKGTSFVIGHALLGNSNLIYSLTNMEVACDAIQTSTQVSNIDAGMALQSESWYHVLCSYNKGVMKLYINGALVSTRSSKDIMMRVCPNSELLIGGWWDGDPSASFNGKIDEVRFYNRELNAEEIKELSVSFR